MKRYKGSIKKWLATIIVLVAILTSIIASTLFISWYTSEQYKHTLELANTVSDVIGQSVAKIILLNDVSAAADTTSALQSFKNLQSMVLYKLDKTPVFQYSKNNQSFDVKKLTTVKKGIVVKDNISTLLIDATYQNTKLGYVELKFSIKTIYDIIKENLFTIILIFIFIFITSLLLANYFAKKFTAPIVKLVNFLEHIEFTDFIKNRISSDGDNNEYTHLYDEVNIMLDRIEHAQKALKLAAVAFETHSGMTITDKNHIILDVNEAFINITGFTKEEAIGKTPSILKSGLQDEKFYKQMHKTLEKYHYWSGEIYNKRKDGTIFPEYLTIQTVLDDNNEILYFVASFVDLTLQKKTEAQLHYLQRYDTLTGLANKDLLIEALHKDLENSSHKKWGFLLIINIREFKLINEAFGYHIGDLVLQKFSQRMKDVEDATLLSRIGADKFCMWFSQVNISKNKTLIESQIAAEYLVDLLSKPYIIENKIINIIVSIGINIYNHTNHINATDILQQTEAALHSNHNQISFFSEDYKNIAKTQIDIYSQLLDAIEYDRFELYYQPQYTQEGRIYSFEALIRWIRSDGTIATPDTFIPVSEKTGLIIKIGNIVLNKACEQLKKWEHDDKFANLSIAVNVSSKQFTDKHFLDYIREAISTYKINPKLLKIELTESIMVQDIEQIVQKMQELQEIGIKLSLDDFGTGYSSLQYLRDLPLNQVKIDQSFVKNMLHSPSDFAIIKSVLLICSTLNIDVIAEGVETKEHFEFLKNLGCKSFQGFYFSKPKKIQELSILLKD